MNTDWSNDLKNLFIENNKVEVEISSSRATATKLLSEKEYAAVIIEDTFKLKNMDYFLRTLSTVGNKPNYIYFTFLEFELYKSIAIPESINGIIYKAFSLPMPKETLKTLIYEDLFPYGHVQTGDFDREFIQILMKATHRVLESMGITDIKIHRPDLLTKMEDLKIKIRGKIIIKSDFFSGAFFLSFTEESYKSIYSEFTLSDIEAIDDTNKDFAGELANMVYGQAKKELAEHGIKLDMAIPILDQSLELKSTSKIFVMPVDSSIGRLYIKLAPNLY